MKRDIAFVDHEISSRRREGGGGSNTYLGEQLVHLATQTIRILTELLRVLVTQEVISHQRIVKECLEYDIEIACGPEIQQSSTSCVTGIRSEARREEYRAP